MVELKSEVKWNRSKVQLQLEQAKEEKKESKQRTKEGDQPISESINKQPNVNGVG